MTKRKKPPAQQLPSRHETAGKSDSWAFSLATVAVVTVVLTVAILIPILTTLERGSRDHQLQPHGRESKENPRAQMLTPTKQTPYELLKKLNTLAYNGDLSALKALITSHRDIDWNSSLATDAHRTPIHYALQGRQDSFVQQSSSLIGQHEEVISYLIAEGYLSGGHGCPVYYAIHLRNTRALATLLKAGDRSSVACLTSLDSAGETALHSAVKSKASGFARFFSKLAKEQPNQQVLDLLGLKPLKLAGSRLLTLNDLNSVTLPRDIELMAKHLQFSANFSTLSDRQGNTLLHTAVYGGRVDVVEILLNSGVPAHSANLLGLTPLHLAYAGGFCSIADTLISYGAAGDVRDGLGRTPTDLIPYGKQLCGNSTQQSNPVRYREDSGSSWIELQQKYLSSGWIDSTQGWNMEHSRCDIDALNSSLSEHGFLARYKGVYRPVRIEGLMGGWPAWEHWRREELLERYGKLKFTVSSIPYAELYYGANTMSAEISLAKYIRDFQRSTSSDRVHPDYIFDGQILHRHSQLSRDAPVPDLFSNFSISLRQFIVGPRHSGSPPHFHGHAFNALVYGVKLWYLWPPSEAYFAFSPVLDWQRSYLERQFRGPVALECVQRPGDIVYVPENWGHAVVNVQDSIAVAYEFS